MKKLGLLTIPVLIFATTAIAFAQETPTPTVGTPTVSPAAETATATPMVTATETAIVTATETPVATATETPAVVATATTAPAVTASPTALPVTGSPAVPVAPAIVLGAAALGIGALSRRRRSDR
jgi:hypothetical protein